MKFRLLAATLVVVAVPDPRAERLDPVACPRPGPFRERRRLAFEVQRPLLGRRVARHAGQEVVRGVDGDVEVHVVGVVRDRVVGACDARRQQPERPLDRPAHPLRRRRRPARGKVLVVHVHPVGGEAGVDLCRVALASVRDRLRVRVGLHVREPPRGRTAREDEQEHDGDDALHGRIITGVPA